MRRLFLIINILSIDVAFGASIMSFLIGETVNNPVSLTSCCILSGAVWCVYTFDRLTDVFGSNNFQNTYRHHFFKQNQKLFWVLLLLIGFTVAVGAFLTLNMEVWFNLLFTAPVLFVYVFANMMARFGGYKFYLKEILIAMVYAVGVCVLPFAGFNSFSLQLALIPSIVFAFALVNLFVISYVEIKIDKDAGIATLATFLGKKRMYSLLVGAWFLLPITILAAIFCLNSIVFGLFCAIGSLLLGILVFFPSTRGIKYEVYRWVNDAVFWVPVLYLWVF